MVCDLVCNYIGSHHRACPLLDKVSVQGSVAVYGPSEVVGLKQLELSSCCLARFRSAGMFKSIELLVVKACTNVPDDLIESLDGLKLKNLIVSRVECAVKIKRDLPRLESLDISGTLTTSLDGIPRGLHRLLLSSCPIGEGELARVPILCPELQELRLPNKIDPAMDVIVTNAFSNLPLVRLDLEGASKLTDAGMSGLSCLRDSLVFLSLVGTGIGNASMKIVGEYRLLQELYLDRTLITELDLPGLGTSIFNYRIDLFASIIGSRD